MEIGFTGDSVCTIGSLADHLFTRKAAGSYHECRPDWFIYLFDAQFQPHYTTIKRKFIYRRGSLWVLAGVAGTGGAVRGITLAAFQLPKVVFIATSAFIDLGVDTSRAVIYVSNGYFDRKYLVLIPFLIAISIVGSYLGKVILKYASEIIFRYMVLTVVTAVSLFQLIKLFT